MGQQKIEILQNPLQRASNDLTAQRVHLHAKPSSRRRDVTRNGVERVDFARSTSGRMNRRPGLCRGEKPAVDQAAVQTAARADRHGLGSSWCHGERSTIQAMAERAAPVPPSFLTAVHNRNPTCHSFLREIVQPGLPTNISTPRDASGWDGECPRAEVTGEVARVPDRAACDAPLQRGSSDQGRPSGVSGLARERSEEA